MMTKKPKLPAKPPIANRIEPVVMLKPFSVASLQHIRDNASHMQHDIRKTIADLEAMGDEINATLAFLRAQRSSKG